MNDTQPNPTAQRVREAIDGAKSPCTNPWVKRKRTRGVIGPPLIRFGQGDTARDYNPPPTDPMIGVRVRCVALGVVVGAIAGAWAVCAWMGGG